MFVEAGVLMIWLPLIFEKRIASADLACAFELTRRVAGNVVAIHADFANINALT
jgi:hypothetical protein